VTADNRLLACAVISLVGHFAFERWLQRLPPSPETARDRKVEIRVIMPTPTAPEPEPEPSKSPEPPPPEPPKRVIHERSRRPVVAEQAETPKEAPPVEHPPLTNDTSTTPVFGVTMESTSQAGNGPAMRVGNSARPQAGANTPADEANAVKPLAEPLAAYQVTKMPLPLGECTGKYTDEAREAAVEGTVILDLIVGEDGRTRSMTVVQGLSHGLDQAAIAALKQCRFSPPEQNGHRVPMRVRGFKIRFVLPDSQ
jgi:TonB family protein